MIKEADSPLTDSEIKALLDTLGGQLSKSKAELVAEIEKHLSLILGIDVQKAFSSVATHQQIRGGAMNLDRTHKSMLVLLAHVLAQSTGNPEVVGG
jgi:hypothetical protein